MTGAGRSATKAQLKSTPFLEWGDDVVNEAGEGDAQLHLSFQILANEDEEMAQLMHRDCSTTGGDEPRQNGIRLVIMRCHRCCAFSPDSDTFVGFVGTDRVFTNPHAIREFCFDSGHAERL